MRKTRNLLQEAASTLTMADIDAFRSKRALAFEHWLKLEYWTRDESVALLLGEVPGSIPQVYKLPGQRAGLGQRYEELQELTKRAESMNPGSGRLCPADVLSWATSIGYAVPMELIAALAKVQTRLSTLAVASEVALTKLSEPKLEPGSEPAPVLNPGRTSVPADIQAASAAPTTPVWQLKWTPQRLAELAAYRAAHGTKKAADQFGITTARIRVLLPSEKPQSKGYSVYMQKMK